MAAYVVPKRVERDGRLVAFEGQVMTEEEAEALGILPKPKPRRTRKPKQEEQQ